MKLFTTTNAIITLGVLAVGAIACEVGCGTGDHNPSPEEIQASTTKRLKNFDAMVNMPETAKKTLESHMGGPAYTNPAIAEAMAKAKANGVKKGPHDRQF